MRAGQRCILREGMISSAIEALRSGESRGNHRPEVAADRVPYILPAVAPHTVVAVGACNILYDSGLLKLLFTGNIPRGVFCERRSQKTRDISREFMRTA